MPVLEYDSTRHMGLNALSLVTHHGGESARCAIARKNSVLLKLIEDHPDDQKLIELATVTMMHSTNAVIANTEQPQRTCQGDPGPRRAQDDSEQPAQPDRLSLHDRPRIRTPCWGNTTLSGGL